ncbi:MAG: LOG family protein [Kiritimatiellia bacterium]
MRGKTIAVFGSAVADPADKACRQAVLAGRIIAEAGFNILCGGYGGVMEAACRGCTEAGGKCAGIGLTRFTEKPNKYIGRFKVVETLGKRLDYFEKHSRAFLALDGGIGTITEVMFFWDIAKAGFLEGRPIFLLGEQWPWLVQELKKRFIIKDKYMSCVRCLPDIAALKTALGHLQ